jgi:(1->4)-alpha-D-glucan 1-alpha-D-glucosylmutase
VNTSWINPNPAYDRAAESFMDAALDPRRSAEFLARVDDFAKTVIRPGLWNSLSQLLIKIAAPGIPDFFQGTELWDFSLVDPDNRRLVDYSQRRAWLMEMLAEAETRGAPPIEALLAAPDDGRIKLWITAAALRLRRAREALFEHGSYEALAPAGTSAEHLFAFARAHQGCAVVAVAGRFFAKLGAEPPIGTAWGDTHIALPAGMPHRRFRDVLTGRICEADADSLPAATMLERLPVALLESVP